MSSVHRPLSEAIQCNSHANLKTLFLRAESLPDLEATYGKHKCVAFVFAENSITDMEKAEALAAKIPEKK